MFGFQPLKTGFGFNPEDNIQSFAGPDPRYASVAQPQKTTKPSVGSSIQKSTPLDITATPVPLGKADYQKAIAPDSVQHPKWKGLTVKEGQKLDEASKGDKYKAEDLYATTLKIKSNKTFLNTRDEQRANLIANMDQEEDEGKKQNMKLMVKVSQFADFAREQALKNGDLGIANIKDTDIVGKLIKTPEQMDAMSKFINDETDIKGVIESVAPGYIQTMEEEEKAKQSQTDNVDGTILGDIAGGIAKSATATGELGAKAGDWLGYNLVKTIFGEEKANEVKAKLGDSFGDTINKTLQDAGVDTESTSFKAGKGAGDFAQLLAGTEIVKGIPAIANIVQGLKGAGKVGEIAGMAGEGALQSVGYSAIADKELPSVQEAGIGAGLNVALGVGGQLLSKGLKAAGNKLQLSGLINPQKLEYVQNALKEGGDQVDNVTEWMNARNLVGSKSTIIKKLESEGQKTYTAVREAVKQADEVVQPIKDTSVRGAIEELIGVTQGVKSPQKQEVYANLVDLLKKHDEVGLKPSEIQNVKDSLDELMNIYTLAGDVKAGVQKADLANLRSNIRGIIEDTVGKATGADIATLNRDTAVAYKLAQGIGKKENAENIRELLSPFAPGAIGGIYGGYQGNTTEEKIMYALAGLVGGQVAGSTRIKTGLGKLAKTAAKSKLPVKGPMSGLASDQIEQAISKE